MYIFDPKLKEKIPAFLRNKFFILFGVYFIYLLFISQNNLISQAKLMLQLHELNKEEAYYTNEIKEVKKERKDLFSGIDNIEKYARENYWMKGDSEDIYIITEKP